MKISEVKSFQNATLDRVEVVEKEDPREFEKFGKVSKVCNCKIKDDSGTMQLTLWNDECDTVSEGDVLKITSGWVKEWNGRMQISTGKNGKIEKL